MFLGKGVLKICSKFKGEHPCRSAISIKLLFNISKIALRHGCSHVNLLHVFRTPFLKNTFGWLLLLISTSELQTFLTIKDDANTVKPRVHTRLLKKFYPFIETISGKKLSERMLYHAFNRVFRLLHSYTRISNFFCKIN